MRFQAVGSGTGRRPMARGGCGSTSTSTKSVDIDALRRAVEALEPRLMLSVSKDANGFTVVTPSANSLVYYVSSTFGKDDGSFNGRSPSTPFQTIAKAKSTLEALKRNGSPDEILLRRGDIFHEFISNWILSGSSATDPFLIGAYTDAAHPSAERPKIDSGRNTGFEPAAQSTNHPLVSHLVIEGVAFEADYRNYRQPVPGKFNTSYLGDGVGGTYGINILGPINDFLVEDCSFQYYRTNITIQTNLGPVSNVTIRRSVIADAYVPNVDNNGATTTATAEGIYADGVAGLTLDNNVLDHNGWADNNSLGCVASLFNHDAYLNTGNSNVVVNGNIFANASSHGLQARAGGIITNNLFLKDPIAMSYGYVNGVAKAGGVFGEISGNIVIDDNSISGASRGWGLEIGNLKPASQGGGTVVHDNLYFADSQNAWPAIQITIGTPTGASVEVGTNDLTIRNNTLYGWSKGLSINPAFVDGGNASTGLNHLVIQNNDFQRSLKTPIIDHPNTFKAASETWLNNRYNDISPDSGSTQWFKLGASASTLAGWQASVEPTATATVLSYPFLQDAGGQPRTTATYNATLGGAANLSAFLIEERRQSAQFWRSAYSTATVEQYLRRGFDIGGPTASLAAADLTDGGAPTVTFSVTYSDTDQVNLASIDNTDVLVTGPGSYSHFGTLVGVASNANGSVRIATYSVPAPNGVAWDSSANGTYAVALQLNAVKDLSGNPAAGAALGQFNVSIDPTAPSAQLTATNITSATASATLSVLYTAVGSGVAPVVPSNSGFETPSVGSGSAAYQYNPDAASWTFEGDSGVSGNGSAFTAGNPNAPQGTQVAFIQDSGDIEQTLGGWANGTYTISFKAAQRQNVASAQSLDVLIDGEYVDTITPSSTNYATYTTASFDVTSGTHTITIQGDSGSNSDTAFVDDVKVIAAGGGTGNDIDVTTIGAGDLLVTGPNGFSSAARFGSFAQAPSGTGWIATYFVDPPAGGWISTANGAYTVSSQASQVLDTNGLAVPAGPLGAFQVNVSAIVPPSASVSAPNITVASSTAETITVTFTDDTGINLNSIASGNFQVLGPNNFVSPVTAGTPVVNGSTVTVLYTLAAPAGTGWTAANNGVFYVVAQSGSPVTDTDGNPLAPGAIGALKVVIDGSGPVAWDKAGSVTTPVTSGPTVVVEYSDDTGIDTTTLDNSDINGTRTDGTITVTANFQSFVVKSSLNGVPTVVDATYSFVPPGGQWQSPANGTYNITLRSSQVGDTVTPQNLNGSQILGTFTIGLETTAPTVTITPVSPNPRTTPVTSMTITFSEAVKGFDMSDVSLNKDGGANLLTGAQTLTTSDNITWTLGNLSGVTTAAGNYTLTIGLGETDLAGNSLAAIGQSSWAFSPTVVSVTVGDGTAQRSMVSSLTVVFSAPVALSSGAFTLVQRGSTATTVNASPNGDGTTWILTFSGTNVETSGSLSDGVYDFNIVAANVHAGSTSGPALAAGFALAFHRLYGDINGDKTVNNADAFQFNKSYLKNRGDAAYAGGFDFDSNGTVNNADAFQFNKRYLKSVSYQ